MNFLSREEARRVYDRIGKLQDSQAFYEDRAVDLLIDHGRLASARRVFEFGCGTGRLAARLLSDLLPSSATYHGVDISPTMVALAGKRLEAYADRARVDLSDGAPPTDEASASCDRFVSTYVLDLLSEPDIAALLREAHRMLAPGGLLCLAGLSTGAGPISRAVARLWSSVHRLRPGLVGGCRPLDLADLLSPQPASSAEEGAAPAAGPTPAPPRWKLVYHARVAPFGVPSEVVVAEPRP